VGRGLLASLAAAIIGVAVTVLVWRAGYIASITSLVIAAGAVYLYSLAAGSTPRKGLIPLILVVTDLVDAYPQLGLSESGLSRMDFISDNIFNTELLGEYSSDMGMFALFAVLGVFGTVRRLFAQD
jgi:hypothetical protein